jgi:hypothetical protein
VGVVSIWKPGDTLLALRVTQVLLTMVASSPHGEWWLPSQLAAQEHERAHPLAMALLAWLGLADYLYSIHAPSPESKKPIAPSPFHRRSPSQSRRFPRDRVIRYVTFPDAHRGPPFRRRAAQFST